MGLFEEGLDALAALRRRDEDQARDVVLMDEDIARSLDSPFVEGRTVFDPVTRQEGIVVGTETRYVLEASPAGPDGDDGADSSA